MNPRPLPILSLLALAAVVVLFVATGILQHRGRPPEPAGYDSKQAVLRLLRTRYGNPEVIEWHGPAGAKLYSGSNDVWHVRMRAGILLCEVHDGLVVFAQWVDRWPDG
jgi:hypothetical protein